MAEELNLIPAEKLQAFTELVLIKAGVPAEDAAIVTDVLITANLSGIDSHGIVRLPHYIHRLDNGTIKKQPDIRFERKAPAVGIVDGDDGLGHVVTVKACDWALELCRVAGTASIVIKNSSHFGMAGYYIKKLTEQGFVGMIMTHTDRLLVPFGGRRPFWGTNPVAIGFPADGIPVILDMSTTSVALGKVILAQKEGRQIPNDWGLDDQGQPTSDPDKLVGLHPIAGPKGSGLAMVIDIFCSLFSGMPFGPHINRMYWETEHPRELGHFLTVWDIRKIVDLNQFKVRISSMINELNALPPAAGFSQVMFPGEIEGKQRKERAVKGIPIETGLLKELAELGARFSIDLL